MRETRAFIARRYRAASFRIAERVERRASLTRCKRTPVARTIAGSRSGFLNFAIDFSRGRHYLPAALFTAHCTTMLSPSLNLNVTGTVEPTVSGFFSFSNIT